MKATMKWIDELRFVGESASGHLIPIDGEAKLAASPMELLLLGVAGCASIDVVMILKKGRHAIVDCQATIDGHRRETPPRIFETMHLHFTVTGIDLPDAAVANAVKLSAEKYCSAALTLKASVDITYSYEIQAAQS
jgi:putative redox protein